ncbi:spore germination protein [Gottfriedia sp. NPDC057991]|uniref:spore germination protein n=1 Tax=Gottfriedia sp. NPDC057991 TaxID=3346298 RepID=UPI0036DB996A
MNKTETAFLTLHLQKNLDILQKSFNETSDLKIRTLKIKSEVVRKAAIVYLDGIIDTKNIQEYLLNPLFHVKSIEGMEELLDFHLSLLDASLTTKIDEITRELSKGKVLLIIDGFSEGILADSSDWQMRALTEPDAQRTARGPMVGFTEQLKVNINLLRNMIQSTDFSVENIEVGRDSKTNVAIVYLDKFVDQKVLDETRKKINDIDVTYLLEARVIEDTLEEKKVLFPLVFTCERPDVSVSALFEGRVVILVNGVPYSLIVPTLFIHYFHQPDEYAIKAGRFFNRVFRLFSWFLSILLMGLYVTMVRFHHDWIPHPFSEKLLTQSDTVFPILLEMAFLVFLFDLLFETSLRIPKNTMLLISLIGAIVVGQTAVEAKLVHQLSLIVVGISMLASSTILAGGLSGAIRVLRILFIIFGYFFGLKGIIVGLMIVTVYMASLRSVGVPYLAPFIPFRFREMKDALFRGDLRKLINSKHTYPHKDNK